MRKVKIFPIGNIQYHVEYAVNKTALEDRINNWIAEEKAHVMSMTSSIDNGLCVVFVLYEENNLKEITDNELLEDSTNPADFSLANIEDAIYEGEKDDDIEETYDDDDIEGITDEEFRDWISDRINRGPLPFGWEASTRNIKKLMDSEYVRMQSSLNNTDLNKVLDDL